MTTHETEADGALERINANMERIDALSQRLMTALGSRAPVRPSLQGPGMEFARTTWTAYMQEWMHNPGRLFEQQVEFWAKSMRNFMDAQAAIAQHGLTAPEDPGPKDPRFTNPLWDTHPYFNFLKRQFLTTERAMLDVVDANDELDAANRKRLRFFTEQMANMMSPTNFLGTNPDALEKAVETEGESLVRGLENLVKDVEANHGELLVTLADTDAFQVGVNIGTSSGGVVYRNELIELIQYTPSTETVHATPLLIFPPWINKFYILDLKEKNSLIKWIVDQGYTLFVVSWVNPGPEHAEIGLEDYLTKGVLAAIQQVQEITGEDQINAVGYCIAGTLLSLTLALLEQEGQKPIKSATFFTTMTTFADQGEFSVFLEDDFVDGIEEEAHERGYLDSFYMSRTFSFLRSNDLIYKPAIRSYMMGETPPAFDLLYWNGDSTNLPGKMVVQYLRELCQEDAFAGEGFDILGHRLRLKDVKIPLLSVACETDHIAAWKSVWRGVQGMGSRSKTFILTESGHIAGIVNPPSKGKYGHYMNPDWKGTPESWQEAAEYHAGSWWPTWGAWLHKRSGKQVPARIVGAGREVLCPAPGSYVVAKKP